MLSSLNPWLNRCISKERDESAYIVFNNKYLAYNFERYLKKGSGRAFAKRHLY